METVLLNASVGVQRVIGRLRRTPSPGPTPAEKLGTKSLAAARHVRAGVGTVAESAQLLPRGRTRRHIAIPSLPTRVVIRRVGHDRVVALAVAGIVVGASALSILPAGGSTGDTGGPTGDGPAPRLAIGGAVSQDEAGEAGMVEEAYVDAAPLLEKAGRITTEAAPKVRNLTRIADVDAEDPEALAAIAEREAAARSDVDGPFLADGTLLKPVAVETSVADGSSLVKRYKVKAGDTLGAIAKRYGVTTMTLYWANGMKSSKDKEGLHRGQILKIPPVTGLLVEVKATDTLASLAATHKVEPEEILAANEIADPNLVVGQVLVLPGAKGAPIPKPKPKTARKAPHRTSSGSTRAPRSYSGGNFAWPAPGGHVSQSFHTGHYGLDIDGETGDPIVAAARGTVTFAGWKSNGGGYQVWIAHGSGLYTTYNHMSSVAVGRGQSVARGQRVGRMGASGYASGSHLHFEVWRGKIWDGGQRVNPLAYL